MTKQNCGIRNSYLSKYTYIYNVFCLTASLCLLRVLQCAIYRRQQLIPH